MKTEIAIHVFASLQGLEKTFETVKSQALERKSEHAEVISMLPKQEEILIDMRRAANLLQLNIAKKDWFAAVRSLQIFYGLNQLVRPDILKAFGNITVSAVGDASRIKTPAPSKEIVFH